MIVYRAIQGFIGGGMIPSVFAAAFTIFPPSKRSVVNPMIGLIATLAPTIGPTVGGYLSHAFSWHWLFLINVIPGIIVTIIAWNFIDFDKPEWKLFKKFDWWGLLAMAVFLGALEYVLEEGNAKDWFNDEHIVIGATASAIGALVFFYRAFKVEFPVVDLRAFSDRNFAFGSMFSFIMGIGLYGLTYLYPVYLGHIRGYDSLMIGETMFVSGLAMFFTAPVAALVFETDVYPLADPVTFTVIFLPACADFSVYVDFVAPEILAPFAYHWYLSVGFLAPAFHVPGCAVSFFPTFAVPVIVGFAVVMVPYPTVTDADVAVTDVYPESVPLTRTVSFLPRSDAVGT